MRERTLRRVSRTNPRSASVRRNRRGRWMGKGMVSIQSFARFQIAKGSDIRQRQRHAELILTPQWSQVEVLVLEIDSETAKIITDLTHHMLDYLLLKVVVNSECSADSLAVGV